MHGKQKKFRVIRKLLLLVMVVCLVPVGQAYYLSYKHQKQQEHLKNLLKEGTAQKEGSGSRNEEGLQGKKGIASQDVSQRYKNLQKENKDFIGWLLKAQKLITQSCSVRMMNFTLPIIFIKKKTSMAACM